MTILAIETSCDETAAAILKGFTKTKPRFELLSNVIASQVKLHKKYGGVYPSLAKREHQKNLVPVLERAFKEASLLKKSPPTGDHPQGGKIQSASASWRTKCQTLEDILSREITLLSKLKAFLAKQRKPNIDAIAVTVGPGLEPCLWVGVNFARALSCYWNIPLIPINHIEAHLLAHWLSPMCQHCKSKIANCKIFPAIGLIVSGGHTQLLLMKGFGKYQLLGETRDDAAGECFDKVARILGIGYPGGPAIEKHASQWKQESNIQHLVSIIKLPRPMIRTQNYDFSFSGLKTAVLYHHKKQSSKTKKDPRYLAAVCYETQQAVIDVLLAKTINAVYQYKAKSVILGGGVIANDELRKQFAYHLKPIPYNLHFLVAPKNVCTDNAAMIAAAAFFNQKKKSWKQVRADANAKIC